jgi:hypothetical protein
MAGECDNEYDDYDEYDEWYEIDDEDSYYADEFTTDEDWEIS